MKRLKVEDSETPRYPDIRFFDPPQWNLKCAELIHETVQSICLRRGQCNILLTGGSAAEGVYKEWSGLLGRSALERVNFYWGDERCVPLDHPESNFGMATRTLFRSGLPPGYAVRPMKTDTDDWDFEASRYEAFFPDCIDILLLGVGVDGHIASLFPWSTALREEKKLIVPVVGPKYPYNRLTITPPVIFRAQTTFVLAPGPTKAAVLKKIFERKRELEEMPARLVAGKTWVVDAAVEGIFTPTLGCQT